MNDDSIVNVSEWTNPPVTGEVFRHGCMACKCIVRVWKWAWISPRGFIGDSF